jgi:hypothetical protein
MSTSTAQAPAKSRLRRAMEARDVQAVVSAFAKDAKFHSPLTERLTFRGRGQIAAVASVILEVFDGFHYTDELLSPNTGFLVARARVDGQDLEMVDHIQFDVDGEIEEMTVFFRPLPAAAVALRLIGAGLARRKSPLTATIISVLARPLAFVTRTGDRIGVGLIRSTL